MTGYATPPNITQHGPEWSPVHGDPLRAFVVPRPAQRSGDAARRERGLPLPGAGADRLE
ncbi:MAG: hypothetical protein JO286_17150 [Solirubrobacterales bacterium]|nr:hypothetical protein [Solirubrobacterales bacterium]MBV9367116.1 hypothetical protein [Solirubrobacterales bacterium]MBV9682926.1 hypothetical protein [Solirubrobacterales bacterium]MBV9808914.1 hypothetical protein [Solirubrobacterales bacterium]